MMVTAVELTPEALRQKRCTYYDQHQDDKPSCSTNDTTETVIETSDDKEVEIVEIDAFNRTRNDSNSFLMMKNDVDREAGREEKVRNGDNGVISSISAAAPAPAAAMIPSHASVRSSRKRPRRHYYNFQTMRFEQYHPKSWSATTSTKTTATTTDSSSMTQRPSYVQHHSHGTPSTTPMVNMLSDHDNDDDVKMPADPTFNNIHSTKQPKQEQQHRYPIQVMPPPDGRITSHGEIQNKTLPRVLLVGGGVPEQTRKQQTTSSSTLLRSYDIASSDTDTDDEMDSITRRPYAKRARKAPSAKIIATTTAATTTTKLGKLPVETIPSRNESPVQETLANWLKNATVEDIERLNQQMLEEATAAAAAADVVDGVTPPLDDFDSTRTTTRRSPPPSPTDKTTRISNIHDLQNSDLRALTEEELEKLNEEALHRAMMGPVPIDRCYTFVEFQALLEKAADHFLDLEELEESRAVRKANQTVVRSDSTNQTRAQYGRTMPTAAKFLLSTIGNLGKGKVFCDIGHGVGNLPLQAAFTYGCESRGIEMVGDRHDIADCLVDFFQRQHQLISDQNGEMRSVGQVRLRHGSLEDSVHRAFLTDTVDLLYCNNYNGVFSVRANERSVGWCLDDYIGGLLTQLKVGAKLVTLYELQRLPLSLQEANEVRLKNGLSVSTTTIPDGTREGRKTRNGVSHNQNITNNNDTDNRKTRNGVSHNQNITNNNDTDNSDHDQHEHDNPLPSFYTLDVLVDPGGTDKLSFTQKPFTYYVYTRVGTSTATFFCHERSCAYNNTPLLAFEIIPHPTTTNNNNNNNSASTSTCASNSTVPSSSSSSPAKSSSSDTRLVPVTSCPYCKTDIRNVRRRPPPKREPRK